jgi:hypothetical protein
MPGLRHRARPYYHGQGPLRTFPSSIAGPTIS